MTETDRAAVGRAAAAALAARFASPKWTPLPHQVPPPGDWPGWALFAGRGAGKTDACAAYVTEHVNGPACLQGPVPHWIGIIGPTQGDAVTSCVNGPSGLRAHDPTARLVTTAGGTVVRWANGSEAKIFGAHSPEDVERLRSGGNRCVAEGTLIRTETGPRPIETIREGDRVWTRHGLRSVLWSGLTRPNTETLVILTSGGQRVEVTPDHRVWVEEHGWIEAQKVTPGSTMVAWNHSLQDPPRGTTGAQSGGVGTDWGTTRTTTATSSTVSCGRRIGDLWMKARCFITRTMTRQTTTWTTSSPSRVRSIAQSIRKSTSTPSGYGCSQATGGGNGPSNSGRNESPGTWCATGAESPSSPLECAPSSAGEPAVRATVVLSVEPSLTRVDTYDLTIERDHEFFAGDLIVHNCLIWAEELAAWRHLEACWDHMRFGLRAGPRPHWIASTTPKPKPLIIKLAAGLIRGVALTTGVTTYDNPHLPQHIRDALEETYGGTQLGSQELLGRILEEDENALWTRATIEAARVLPDAVPDLVRITVGVDPSGGAGEQGIVVAGKSGLVIPGDGGRPQAHGYVLDDRTCHLPPDGWGRRAVQAAVDWQADDLVCEVNYGGAMAVATIRAAADALGVDIPIRTVTATRGKAVRAQPVSALTAQGRWHHAGVFEELETQLTTWHPELGWSPDRLDAMVWGPWHMKLVRAGGSGVGSLGTGAASQNIGGSRGR